MKKIVDWRAVIVYYLIACAISWPFFWWRDINSKSFWEWDVPIFIKTWTYMWGPGISAIICMKIFKKSHEKTMTFFGTSIVKSLLFWFVPLIAMSFLGVKNEMNINSHLYPILIWGLLGFVTILGEELGWTGYLQDAFKKIPRIKRSLLIGIMWELWHFTNRTTQGSLIEIIMRVLIFIIFLSIIAYIISFAIEKTKSTIVAVTFHAWINIVFGELYSMTAIIIFLCSVVFWILMLLTWNKKIITKTS